MIEIKLLWAMIFLLVVSSALFNATEHSGSQHQQFYNYYNAGMGYNYSFEKGR